LREVPLDTKNLNAEQLAVRKKISGVIDLMMQEPMSFSARIEVDAFGLPVKNSKTQ